MDLQVNDSIAILSRTPPTLDAMLRGLPDAWTRATEGPDTWSPFDVVGHLIHCELTDWLPRILIVLNEGESRPFEPFDRFAHFKSSQGKTLEQLLDQFTVLREKNLAKLKALALHPAQFELKGRHPALGTVTLGNLLASWVLHDLTHVAQIARVMAKQYADHVGPFAVFLSVLRDRLADQRKSA